MNVSKNTAAFWLIVLIGLSIYQIITVTEEKSFNINSFWLGVNLVLFVIYFIILMKGGIKK